MSIEPNEDRLGELLLRWDELRRQGRDLTAGELCTDCPELLQELARRIEAVREMDSVLASEETQRRSTSLGGVSKGASPNRGLPAALHASAVYRPQRHHAAGGLGESSPLIKTSWTGWSRSSGSGRISFTMRRGGGSSARRPSLPGCNTPASCRSTAWARMPTGRSTPCP